MDMLITIDSIDGMHPAFTETGENASIQRQLITPPTRQRRSQGRLPGRRRE
jgi:hypothetical protein